MRAIFVRRFVAAASLAAACSTFSSTEEQGSPGGPDAGADGLLQGAAGGAKLVLPERVSLVRGRTVKVVVDIQRDRFDDAIVLAPKALPQGVVVAPSPVIVPRGASKAEIPIFTETPIAPGSEGELVLEARQESGRVLSEAKARAFVRGAPGEIDTRFATNGAIEGVVGTAPSAVLPDGRFVVAINDTSADPYTHKLRRHTATGAVDGTFGTNGEMVVSGRAASSFATFGSSVLSLRTRYVSFETVSFHMARLSADGVVDSTYGTAGDYTLPADVVAESLVVGPTGAHAVIGGGSIVWLTPSGGPDTSVNAGARSNTGVTIGQSVRTADALVAVSGSSVHRFKLAGGVSDPAFGSSGQVLVKSDASLRGIAVDAQNRYVVAGVVPNNRSIIARVTTPGTLDPTFGTAGIATVDAMAITAMFVEPDGRILVGGSATGACRFVRLLPDGTVDGTFGTSGTADLPTALCAPIAIRTHADALLVFSAKIFRLWN